MLKDFLLALATVRVATCLAFESFLEKHREKLWLGLGGALFLSIFAMPHPDLWRRQIWAGLLVGTFTLCAILFQKGMRIPAIALFYFFYCQIRLFGIFPQYQDWSLQSSAQSFAMLICVTVISGLPHRKQHQVFLELLPVIALSASLWLVAHKFFTKLPYAFMNNPAADASLLAVLYPITAFHQNAINRWLEARDYLWRGWIFSGLVVVLPLIAIACCSSTTAVLSVCLAIVVLAWRSRKEIPVWIMPLGALIPLASIPFFVKDHFFNDNGRHEVWALMARWWWGNVPEHWIGNGSGSFFFTGPAIQQATGTANGSLFGFLHNEYLQVVFEQGYVGGALLLLVGVWTLKKSFDRPWLFASLLTYGFIMAAQFPFRFFASALIGAVLVREAHETRTT